MRRISRRGWNGSARRTAGKRAVALAIGLDLGGTQVRAALISAGKVLRKASDQTDVAGGPQGVMRQFRALAEEACGGSFDSVRAIGVSAPGPLDTVSGIVGLMPTLPGWEDFPLRGQVAQLFGRPAVVENDGIAAAFGEWKHGAGQGLSHLVYVTVSTGIGGGVVVDGHLMHGRRGMGGHVGHFRLAQEGPTCSCGATGCFEALAAGTALDKRAQAEAAREPEGYLGMEAKRGPVGARQAVEGARCGDPQCIRLIDQEADYLGMGFTGLIHLYSPERIIMGGGVSQAFDLLNGLIHARIAGDAMAPFKDVPVVPAQLGDNSGLVGAAALAMAGAIGVD
jgi:glucokinase